MRCIIFTLLALVICNFAKAQTADQIPNTPIYYTSDYVGVGTNTPSSLLHIYGQQTIGTPANFSNSFIKLSSGTEILAFDPNQIYADNNLNIQSSTGLIGFYTNDIQRMQIGNNGNVCIGTGSAGSKLTVEGVIRSQLTSTNFVYNFFVSGDGNSYMNYVGGSESSRIGFQMDGASKVSIYKNGNFIVHSGNMGIGFNNPQYKLAVNGIISATEVKVNSTPNSDYVFELDTISFLLQK